MTDDLQSRITVEEGKRGGKPCIRGMRIAVADVLGWLAAGESHGSILEYHPDLEEADILAALAYASEQAQRPPHAA